MFELSTRFDPISGRQVFMHPAAEEPPQNVLEPRSTTLVPCYFCEMGTQYKQEARVPLVWVSGKPRPVVCSINQAFVVPDEWSSSGTTPQGFAELVLNPEHICWPHQFTFLQWKDLWDAAFSRIESHKMFSANSHLWADVGKDAGRSLDHFNIHVAGTSSKSSESSPLNGSTLKQDLDTAKQQALILFRGRDAISYVPYAPAFKAEIRMQAENKNSLIKMLFDIVQTVEKADISWSYNILVHPKYLFTQICFRPKPFGALEIMNNFSTTAIFPNQFLLQLKGK